MKGGSYVTLIFIILSIKFSNQVTQLLTHVEKHCGQMLTSLLWVTYISVQSWIIYPYVD